MKVLQLIDSLNTGGAERVAVNYANALVSLTEGSYLCATREEGPLKESLFKKVHYLFLKKTATIDIKAIIKLNGFIKDKQITIIHAHSSSFFLGTLLKVLNPKLVLVWHEHYGNRNQTSNISKFILKSCSYFFSCIITVNESLKLRSQKKLLTNNVYVLTNYPVINSSLKLLTLHGEMGKRVICLANLRPDKDHINLLKAFKLVVKDHSDWTLHLVGQDYQDKYSKTLKAFISEQNLKRSVFIYGSCLDIDHILNQSTIGVLSSKSEGMPVALLEYGLAKLPVISTNVGDCGKVISSDDEGLLVQPKNEKVLAKAILTYINNLALRAKVAENLHLRVTSTFSEANVIESLMIIYKAHQK